MTVRYRCRYCEVEIGTLPFTEQTFNKLHLLEAGEIDDYIENDSSGDVVVQTICEQCEQAVKQFPDYYALKKWLQ